MRLRRECTCVQWLGSNVRNAAHFAKKCYSASPCHPKCSNLQTRLLASLLKHVARHYPFPRDRRFDDSVGIRAVNQRKRPCVKLPRQTLRKIASQSLSTSSIGTNFRQAQKRHHVERYRRNLLGEHTGRYCEIALSRELSLQIPEPALVAAGKGLRVNETTRNGQNPARCTSDAP